MKHPLLPKKMGPFCAFLLGMNEISHGWQHIQQKCQLIGHLKCIFCVVILFCSLRCFAGGEKSENRVDAISCPELLAGSTSVQAGDWNQSKWKTLHERGVQLDDATIDFIVNTIDAGSIAALKYLNRPDYDMKYIFSDNLSSPGYVAASKAINIPTKYLNSFLPSHLKGEALGSLSIGHDLAPIHSSMREYLFAVGIEETIHHFQDVGHPMLHASLSDTVTPLSASRIDYLMTSFEVEARRLTDAVLSSLGKSKLWEPLDEMLHLNYPDHYGKTDLHP